MRIALDTNLLAYAEGLGDETRCQLASDLIAKLNPVNSLVPLQVLGELSRVLTAKMKKSSEDAREMLLSWADAMVVADTTWSAFQAAMDLSVDHQISMWDALILSVAAENKCRLLLSEDFQNGFTWRGVTVVNPFETKAKPYKLLAMAT
jgi:predicted nucleic acid-binding protein